MGSTSSKSQNAEQALSSFSPEEHAQILHFFDTTSGNSNASSLTPNQLERSFSNLGSVFSTTLIKYFQAQSTSTPSSTSDITKEGYTSGLYILLRSSIDEQAHAFFQIYENSSSSLKQLVHDIALAGVQTWLSGSGLKITGSLKASGVSAKDSSIVVLTEHLITYWKSTPKGPIFSADDQEKHNQGVRTWLDASSSNTLLSEQDIVGFFKSTLPFQILFKGSLLHTFLQTPILTNETIQRFRIQNIFSPPLISFLGNSPSDFSRLLSPSDYFLLTYHLPDRSRLKPHTLLYSSRRDGNSWQIFFNRIKDAGSTILLIKDKDGFIFGGYADDDWETRPKFYGNPASFLFTLRPAIGVYSGRNGVNENFQYLEDGQKTLPNGLGMGGQMDYFGLWIGADFVHGHSKAGPKCSTYDSPRLSREQDFQIDEVEVWLVHETTKENQHRANVQKRSVLDHIEDSAVLEMSGRTMYSKQVREPNLDKQ